ncbi:hypothetical protein PIB30_043977 [Stylosanthes scabra]|uniref:Uncharacterized protein n=1 Tax=Stylosanthes scabra TaxID=79078 RepID=A0ABU6SFT4_9FABA|nr:hypothetical protein [Stylosanthes scabra]
MGFGALEHLSTTNMSKQLMMELVDCFNTMRTTLGTVKLDATKVAHALGLNGRGDIFEKKIVNKTLNDEQKAAVKMFKGATAKILRKIVVETLPNSEENTRKFKRAFLLYVQKVFLCSNNSMPLSPKHFPPIVDVDNTSKMNWRRHVCSFLLDGIIDMRRRNLKGVEGCVFALLIIYMHETHFGENSEHEKAWPPWIKYWKGETLQKRIRVEKKDSTGLLYQANQRKGVTKKEKPSGLKIGKKEALEDDPKGKQILGKRKHVEEESEGDSSESGSEGDSSESKYENGSESEPDSEETNSEDESLQKNQQELEDRCSDNKMHKLLLQQEMKGSQRKSMRLIREMNILRNMQILMLNKELEDCCGDNKMHKLILQQEMKGSQRKSISLMRQMNSLRNMQMLMLNKELKGGQNKEMMLMPLLLLSHNLHKVQILHNLILLLLL